jgi:glycosyltransferase involved in cell wall biosynthesis
LTEYLLLASSFDRWAGPNNPILDLSNYLFNVLNIDLMLVTHKSKFNPDFAEWIHFPILPSLEGSSSAPHIRLVFAPLNIGIIRKIIKQWKISKNKIFVNASIDTLFEAHYAAKAKICTGYNVLGNDTASIGYHLLDYLAIRTSVGRIVAHTEYQKNLYLRMGIDENSISVIPHCIDLGRIEKAVGKENGESAGAADEPTIFYGGRLSVEKGIRELVECYRSLLKETSAKLVLVGDGPLRDWILEKKKQIERKHRNSKIVFLGKWQPPETLLKKMVESDIVALPSYHEMCPIILLEAMCLKKAIVSTSLGGPREMITHGINGLLIDPHDRNDLKDALIALTTDSKLRDRLGTNAFQTLQQRYEVSVVAPRFLEFWDSD